MKISWVFMSLCLSLCLLVGCGEAKEATETKTETKKTTKKTNEGSDKPAGLADEGAVRAASEAFIDAAMANDADMIKVMMTTESVAALDEVLASGVKIDGMTGSLRANKREALTVEKIFAASANPSYADSGADAVVRYPGGRNVLLKKVGDEYKILWSAGSF